MFNQALKERFINQYRDSASTVKTYTFIMDYVGRFEDEYQCDLYQMNDEQAQTVVDGYGSGRNSTTSHFLLVIRLYIKWCKSQGIQNVTGSFDGIVSASISSFRNKMIGSPAELAEHLNRLFNSTPDDKQVDNTYRCFWWFAFMGVDEETAVSYTVDDINLDDMTVLYKGSKLDIPKEAYASFRNCVRMDSFMYRHPLYIDRPRLRPRVPGNQLLRGLKGEVTASKMRRWITAIHYSQIKSGVNLKKITYSSIWRSGILYRSYEQERAGIHPDFSGVAEENVSKELSSYKVQLRKCIRDFKADYDKWKLAFVVI